MREGYAGLQSFQNRPPTSRRAGGNNPRKRICTTLLDLLIRCPRFGTLKAALGTWRGRRGLVVGIANEHSIAYGCAVKLHAFGAELAGTYLNEKAEHYVRPLAEQLQAELILPLDVEQPGQLEAVFERIRAEWGRLDFVIHSIAFAPRQDLHGRVVDCSLVGFQQAMRVSCYSFIEMARLAEPLITPGGALLTMSYYGADKVVKARKESACSRCRRAR
jgi:enoyl-[acyl-carrier-protein] reductase (NADH)